MLHDNDFSNYLQKFEGILKDWLAGNHPPVAGFQEFCTVILQEIFRHLEKLKLENSVKFEIAPSVGPLDIRKQVLNLENQGKIGLLQGRYPEALKSFNQAMAFNEKVADSKKMAELQCKTAQIHVEFGNWEVAQLLLRECQNYFLKHENHLFLTQIRFEKARIAFKTGRYFTAQKRLESALNTAEHMHHFEMINSICIQLGVLLQMLNSSSYILAYFEEALRVAQKALAPRGIADAYYHLGAYYQSHKDDKKAGSYYEIAKHLCQQHDFLFPQGYIWLQQAILSADIHRKPDFLIGALRIFIEAENQLGLAKCMQFLAKQVPQNKNWETVQKLFELTIEIFQNYGAPYELGFGCLNYGDLLLEKEQISDAIPHYEMASNLFRTINRRDLSAKIEAELSVLTRFSIDYSEILPQ